MGNGKVVLHKGRQAHCQQTEADDRSYIENEENNERRGGAILHD